MAMKDFTKKDIPAGLWTIQQTAAYFTVGVSTVRGWMRDGTIKPNEVVKIGRVVRIARGAIERITKTKMTPEETPAS